MNRLYPSSFIPHPLFFFLLVFLFSSPYARTKWEKSIDTFSVEMTKDHFDSAVTNWVNKIHGRRVPREEIVCDTIPPYYLTGMLRTGLFIKTENIDSRHLKIDLTHIWNRDYRKYALYRIPNVTYTLKQELGFPRDAGDNIHEKSYWAFAGLTLLNSGAGMVYISYKSPYSYEIIPFTILYAIMDAALTAGLFVNDRGIRGFSAIFLPAAKLCVGIGALSIREHNKHVRTGYKFILGK